MENRIRWGNKNFDDMGNLRSNRRWLYCVIKKLQAPFGWVLLCCRVWHLWRFQIKYAAFLIQSAILHFRTLYVFQGEINNSFSFETDCCNGLSHSMKRHASISVTVPTHFLRLIEASHSSECPRTNMSIFLFGNKVLYTFLPIRTVSKSTELIFKDL